MIDQMETKQVMSGAELAIIIRILREMRQWSQDTLSALSRVSVRTIQRVESGEPSNADTRRALAMAFQLNDIDVFNKPISLPDQEQIKAEVEKLKRENLALEAINVTSGAELIRLYATAQLDGAFPAVDLEGDVAEAFAGLVDYLREYRECSDVMSETDKLHASREVQIYLDKLSQAGFSVIYARRDTKLVSESWVDKTPWQVTIAYLTAFPKGTSPKQILVPRKVRF